MELRSRIKKYFTPELLHQIAAVCDTMRINSAHHKMVVVQQLLRMAGVQYNVLGGATNRLTLSMDSYTVKIAVDHQGYVDNEIEFSISQELQPYVTKTYETNGYVLVCEEVRLLSLSEFKLLRSDILTILSELSSDYLMGDVGYDAKNYENWGIREDGSLVILDYAYIHRATETLFVCEVCGEGILRYDSNYNYLKCSNAANCTATFSYIDRKRIQGDQVDLDMVEEAKSNAIKIRKGHTSRTVTDNFGRLFNGNHKITSNFDEYLQYIKEKNNMSINYEEQAKAMDLMVAMAASKNQAETERATKELTELYNSVKDEDEEVVEYEEEPTLYDMIENQESSDEEEDDDYDNLEIDYDDAMSLDDLVSAAKHPHAVEETIDEAESSRLNELDELTRLAKAANHADITPDEPDKEELRESVEEMKQVAENSDTPVVTADVQKIQLSSIYGEIRANQETETSEPEVEVPVQNVHKEFVRQDKQEEQEEQKMEIDETVISENDKQGVYLNGEKL